MRSTLSKPLLLIVSSLVLCLPAAAQKNGGNRPSTTAAKPTTAVQATPAGPETLQLQSKLMRQPMSYRVILPVAYKNAATRFPVLYLLHGLDGHYDNWTEKTALTRYALRHNLIIVNPEGGDGWYTDSATDPAAKWESYIIKELIPEIDRRYRTLADRDHRFIAGLSMGGYGSIKFGLKYPEMFSLVGSFSGALNTATWNEQNAGHIGKSVDLIFGPENSQTRRDNNVFDIVKRATTEEIGTYPFIYLSSGTEDPLFDSSAKFDSLLLEKKVPHEYREHPGGHDWKFWDDQAREFLELIARTLRTPTE